MTLSLRPAQAADIDAIGALHYDSRIAAYRDFVPIAGLSALSPESLTAWWRERFAYESDTHRLTVAFDDDQLVGFSYVGPEEYHEAEVGQLYAIHLDPTAQGRGIGRALMVDALEAMSRKGWERVVLWVLEGNTHARRFYERGGWRPDGREREELMGAAPTRQLRYERRSWLGESA
ncbi:L-amino acid N-acyltransferase YncA [Asanoa hainanensis]|uniref:L-amino acid N-acyltransferase YncA n=1 Tax=Asanoa hainanensis TaxID=560556 RepID=A0A239I8Q5_9ACTN|nr:GNAT family N-acetyltransferase [Asanoa hainanensis]SNS90206.1 L-amino acid N-acyltransferase YncA [Asanoa hainanensis]